jgi:flagellar biogenesis protein FliO
VFVQRPMSLAILLVIAAVLLLPRLLKKRAAGLSS